MKTLCVFVMFFLFLSLISCSKKTKEEIKDVGTSVKEDFKVNKDKFVASFNKKLDEMDTKIEALNEKLKERQGESRAKLEKQIEDLKGLRHEIAEKAKELSAATQEKWAEMMNAAEKSYDNLKNKIEEYMKED